VGQAKECSTSSRPSTAVAGFCSPRLARTRRAQQWLAGNLGDDLDVVVEHALELVL
jgi:hypothetical protein